MLKVYDYIDEILATGPIRQAAHRANLRYYASDLMAQMGEADPRFRGEAVRRAMQVCHAAGISLDKNFRQVHVFAEKELAPDWLMSPLASCLFLMNGDPASPLVAKAQILALMNMGGK